MHLLPRFWPYSSVLDMDISANFCVTDMNVTNEILKKCFQVINLITLRWVKVTFKGHS